MTIHFDVDAYLFRVAAMFQSTEETRYYLNGVHIEPHHQEGVFLVATDGHRLFVAWDVTGKIEGGAATVQLGKDQLKACKEGRGETEPRRVIAVDEKQPLTITADGEAVSIQRRWHVDGSFPDWRMVMRMVRGDGHLGCVNATYLQSFAEAAKALGGDALIEVSHVNKDGAALIRFKSARACGLLMQAKWDFPKVWPQFLGFEPDPLPDDAGAENKAA